MNQYKSNAPLRVFYLFGASVIWLGIWLTGFSEASWVLYVPAVTFVFAAITGFCPSLITFRKAMGQ
jgi:hypothetical protein